MYSQLIYFIIALMLFTIQQPGNQPYLPPAPTFLAGIGIFLVYVMICRTAFRRLQYAMWQNIPTSVLTHRQHQLEARLSILALVLLIFFVYMLNIKFYFRALPGFDTSLALSGTLGLILYLVHLAVIWFFSYPIYKHIHHSDIGIAGFLKGHLSFNSAILVPWLFLSLILDLMEAIQGPALLKSEVGQFISLGFVLLCFILFGPFVVVRLWGCTPLPKTSTRKELQDFIDKNHFRIGNFVQWPLFGGEMLTAGIMGILPGWRYILITQGLLSLLTVDELKAVVAHEMGHVRRFHLLFYLCFFICYSVLTYSLNDVILLLLLQNGTLLEWALTPDNMHLTLFSIVYSIPLVLLLVIYFRYIFGFFLRNSERQADIYAMQLIGHPYTLISAFEKIAYYSGQIRDLPSWHHYSIRQRIDFLLNSYEDASLVRRHHKKLYGTAVVFLFLVASLIFWTERIESTSLVKNWNTELQLNMIKDEIRRKPDNPELLAAYGGLLLEKGRFEEAKLSLEKALEMEPNDATTMNNLAWLYATAPPPYFQPRKALELALAAKALDPAPQVLDTLAEAYFANGRYREALQVIESAIEKHPKNEAYFLGQRLKFQDALQKSLERRD